MFSDVKDLFARAGDHFLEDLAGAAALIVMLIVGLHLLPGMI